MQKSAIPVTILSGFLGSGKTTLLNHLIHQNPTKKFAIIENEFGEINIDSALVVGVKDGIFELSNGCICCSINTELVATLYSIIEKFPHINHLLIETTGIADPGVVANSFLGDASIKSTFRLDAIVSMADAQFIEQQLINHEEARKQIAMADIVLLNKIDKVDPYTLDTAKNVLRRINPRAEILNCNYGKAEEIDILNLHAFSPSSVLKLNFSNFPSTKPAHGKFLLNKGLNSNHHNHTDIASHSIILEQPLDSVKFDTWINLMLNFNAQNFYRIKGILNMEHSDCKIIFQAVNNQYVLEVGDQWGADTRVTKIVFIGKNLDKESLEEGLLSCCYSLEFVSSEDFYKSILVLQEKLYWKNKEHQLHQ